MIFVWGLHSGLNLYVDSNLDPQDWSILSEIIFQSRSYSSRVDGMVKMIICLKRKVQINCSMAKLAFFTFVGVNFGEYCYGREEETKNNFEFVFDLHISAYSAAL